MIFLFIVKGPTLVVFALFVKLLIFVGFIPLSKVSLSQNSRYMSLFNYVWANLRLCFFFSDGGLFT